MMEMFGLVEKDYSNVQGVSMEPGTFNSFPCYRLHKDALISQPTKYVQELSEVKLLNLVPRKLIVAVEHCLFKQSTNMRLHNDWILS